MATLIAAYVDGSLDEIRTDVIEAVGASVGANQRLLAWKVRAVRLGTVAVVAGLATTGARLVSLATS